MKAYYFLFTIKNHLPTRVHFLRNPCCHCSCVSQDIMMGNVLNSNTKVNGFASSLQHFSINIFFFFGVPHFSSHWHKILHVLCHKSHRFFHGITFKHAPLGPPHALQITFKNLVRPLYAIHPPSVDRTAHIKLFNEMYHEVCHHIKERRGHLHLQHA